MKTTDTLIISYDFTHGKDKSVLIIGRKQPNQVVDIVNAFQGEEAENIYKSLITKKENHNVQM